MMVNLTEIEYMKLVRPDFITYMNNEPALYRPPQSYHGGDGPGTELLIGDIE